MTDQETIVAIAERVRAAGGRALLVGGCVRDKQLGLPCGDFDVEVYGLSAERLVALLSETWPLDSVGASFGVLKLRHRAIDVALPRRENAIGRGHRDFAIATDPTLSFAEAASRRDFTINAIGFDPLTGAYEDPWNGREDLHRGILRAVSEHFCEDPLRVLRGMQFLARFPSFAATDDTVALCRRMGQETLPFERLAAEWEKLFLKGVAPSHGLEFLRACGWLRFYQELDALVGCEQDPVYHPEGDVWTHTLEALDAAPALRSGNAEDDLTVALAVLCHDFGKPVVSRVGADGRIHAYNHEVRGVPLARAFVRRYWKTERRTDLVARLVACHMRPVPLVLQHAGDKAYRRLSVDARRLDLLADVTECDVRGTRPPEASLALIRAFRERVRELAVDRAPPEPLVRGRDLLARGRKPGPAFHDILDACYQAQLDGAFADAAGAAAWLDAHLDALG